MISTTVNKEPHAAVRQGLAAGIAAIGFVSISVQALALRELLVAWRGNEMSLGIALSMWLALSGFGSLLGARLRSRGPRRFATDLCLLGALAPVTVLATRFTPVLFGIGPGQSAGPAPLAAAAALAIAPFTLLSGSLFPSAVALARGGAGAQGAGRVYVLEAVGAVIAGLLVSFYLLPHWSALRASFLVGAVGATAAWMAAPPLARRRGAVATALLAIVAAVPLTDGLDESTLALRWRSLGFVASRSSIHGRIVAARYGSQESLYENGILIASSPDRRAAEEAVHMALLQHPSPERVLLAGGGLGGTLGEILRHRSVRSVDYVELDPELVAAAREHFPGDMTAGLDDQRVRTHFGDARRFVKASRGPYDCVVVNLPDPTTLQINRLYTVQFFSEVAANMRPGGVIGLSVTSSENYIPDELAAFLATLRASLQEVWSDVVLLPGDPCHLLAGDRPLTRDADTLAARVERRAPGTAFVRRYYLADRLSEGRIAALDRSLDAGPVELNTDLKPAAYYRSLVLWNREFSGFPEFLKAARRHVTAENAVLAAVAIALAGLAACLLPGRATPLRLSVVGSIALVGATEISLEIAALTAYQSLSGYVYGHIALVTAAFMTGLAIGGAVGTGLARRPRPFAYVALSAAIVLVPLGLTRAVSSLATSSGGAPLNSAPLFLLVVVAAALLAGLQFPLATAIVADARRLRTGAGRLYAADLAGAAVAAPVVAIVLLPVMGLGDAMKALALLNAGMLAALAAGALRGLRGTR